MLISHDVSGTILVHHFPCEIICAVNIADFDNGIAVASVSFPRSIVNEDDFFDTRFM
jgi:hypothetical protein